MDTPMTDNQNLPGAEVFSTPAAHAKEYVRFDLVQRIEHLLFLTSFTILGITGLVQKFAEAPLSIAILRSLGGIEQTRIIHRTSAIVMMWVSIFHVIAVLYRMIVLRQPWTMMPGVQDIKDVFDDVMYYLGLRKHRAYYGRYNYAEKAEYFAVVWGTVVMAITGFMMWNPITTASVLPGEVIPAAKAAHGGEALLAVLAIILWHMYHVHIKRFNKSMFTGKLSREEMEEEHPAELAAIERGEAWTPPAPEVIRKRQRVFIPVAAVLGVALSLGVMGFIFVEYGEGRNTAITTLPQGETAAVFAPVTPTPRPTLAPTPTPELGAGISANSWDGAFSALFRNRCGTCHVRTAVGGLSLASYENALKGGPGGPAIVPGNPDASMLVKIQTPGNHPGQLTVEELNQVISWIQDGAPQQ